MNQRYLVTHVMSSDPSGPPIVKAFPVSAQVRAQDITYPVNTLVFFFVSTEMTLEELVSQFFTIREKNLNFMMMPNLGVEKFYVPEENRRYLWKKVKFQNGDVDMSKLIERGMFEIV